MTALGARHRTVLKVALSLSYLLAVMLHHGVNIEPDLRENLSSGQNGFNLLDQVLDLQVMDDLDCVLKLADANGGDLRKGGRTGFRRGEIASTGCMPRKVTNQPAYLPLCLRLGF